MCDGLFAFIPVCLSHLQMTALSVGYIQTYRDSVDSLGESVDMSIKVRGRVLSPFKFINRAHLKTTTVDQSAVQSVCVCVCVYVRGGGGAVSRDIVKLV